MEPHFKISAPGRLVLSGEHLAEHKTKFLVSALGCRTKVEFRQLYRSFSFKIIFPNIDLKQEISYQQVQSFFSIHDVEGTISNPLRLIEYVKYLITVVRCMWTTHEQRFSLQILFFLLYYIAHQEKLEIIPFYMHVSTDIPIGEGLGSSTSFAVCIAACFIHLIRLRKGPHRRFNNTDLWFIKKYTKICEESIQDYAFAEVDAHICTYGRMALCERMNHKLYRTESANVVEMRILLVDSNTRQSRSMRAQQTAIQKCDNSLDFQSLQHKLGLADWILSSFKYLSFSTKKGSPDKGTYLHLQMYVSSQQQDLSLHNLSTEAYDKICAIAEEYNFAGKLTGFGGKYIYILVPPKLNQAQIANLLKQLASEGFNDSIKTTFCCSGVRIEPL